MNKIISLLLIISLTLLSGLADSQGFIHASLMWKKDKIIWEELFKSFAGFAVGISSYWIALRYLQQFNVVSAEIQTLGWFTVTIVGVALASGDFFKWRVFDQTIAFAIVFLTGLLLFRTGG